MGGGLFAELVRQAEWSAAHFTYSTAATGGFTMVPSPVLNPLSTIPKTIRTSSIASAVARLAVPAALYADHTIIRDTLTHYFIAHADRSDPTYLYALTTALVQLEPLLRADIVVFRELNDV
jgi:hypothetical protein